MIEAMGGFSVRRLVPADIELMRALNAMFGEAFGEVETYTARPPRGAYLDRLLRLPEFVALVAMEGGAVIGGLVAYELIKFEQERSEFYIYDLAVRQSHRRRGVATVLIEQVREISAANNAEVLFVQADHGDEPAIALYSKLGRREDVLHFDIEARRPQSSN